MLEEISFQYGWDEPSETPDGENDRVWGYRALIREKCALPEEPPHSLSPEVVDEIRFVRHDIAVLLPNHFTSRDAYKMFLTHENPMGRYYKIDRFGEVCHDHDKEMAAMTSSSYKPDYWSVEIDDVIASYRRSLDEKKTLRSGYVDFPARDRLTVQLGVRRTPKPDPVSTVEGLFYQQFITDEWHWEHGAPQLYAAIEKNLEGRTTDDPFEWVRERATIAAGYSVLGGGKECSPPYLAKVYEGMASTVCNPPPVGHDRPIEYEVGEEEQNLLIELYARHAATVCPEMVALILDHAILLTPEILRTDTTIREFLTHLPKMLDNGLNIHRIMEYSRAPTKEQGTGFARLRSAMTMAMSVFRGEKPWWFREDFDLSECFDENEGGGSVTHFSIKNDEAGRQTLERIAERAAFSFQHILRPYLGIGHRMTTIAPFTEDDAIDFTAFVTEHYGIGNAERSIAVLQTCFYVLMQEEEANRPQRLKELKEHLDDVKPETATMARMEAGSPVFELPGISNLAATMLGKHLTDSGIVHPLRIGFDHLAAIDEKFSAPLAERARLYPPALPSNHQNMERHGLLAGQSAEALIGLPVPEGHLASPRTTNAALGMFDFYAQLREECGAIDSKVARSYFLFSAARMPDPWHPPKGFLKFLEVFNDIDTPGWRFTGLEHPKDRAKVGEENQRKEISKQLLVSNMLDAWIMDLLTTEELESLFAWLSVELTTEQRIEIEKDVMYDSQDRLAALDDPPRPKRDDDPYGEDCHDTRTPEEKICATDERIEQDVRMGCDSRTQKIRTQRMVLLQQTFTLLSVFNSMAIAGSFTREELRSVLVENILPNGRKHADRTDDAQPIRQGPMLSSLLKMQEMGGLDHEALRDAVQGSGSPAEAKQTAQNFIEQVLLQCMERSLERALPHAVDRVSELMKAKANDPSADADRELSAAVASIRDDLQRELEDIWEGAPFVAGDMVERLLREFRVPQYAELFGPIRRFNVDTLPAHLPKASENPRHGDLQDSNAHSARMFFFIGGRILQERAHANGEDSFGVMQDRYGNTSHVDMSGGAALVTSLTRRCEDQDSPEDLAAMYHDLGNRLPDFQKHVDRWRLADVPLGPIGGRWHFGNPVNDKHMELFTHLLSLGKTPFRMIHANTSLIIPGFMSRNEMRTFILMLALEGLIDPTKPELQIGVTGRLSPELCAHFGSSCMLGTSECAPFKLDSFVPNFQENRELTAARIVAYDAYPESGGTRRNFELPFMSQGSSDSKNVQGRTDILGRWNVRWNIGNAKPDIFTMDDLDIAHTVGGALRHVQHGGPLREAGIAYMNRHRKILNQYGLGDTLDAPWVYTRVHEAYDGASQNPEHFERCVKPCMDTHFAHAGSFGNGCGAVFEVRENIDMLLRQVETVGAEVIRDPRYEDDVRALLQATSYESLHS